MNTNELKDAFTSMIADFYLESKDFNGIPLSKFLNFDTISKADINSIIAELILSNRVFAMFDSHCHNPHVVRIQPLPIDEQIVRLESDKPQRVCLYPSENEVKARCDISRYDDRPFTKSLLLLCPQLNANYFILSVLERYFHDPRYHFKFEDYCGSISICEKYSEDRLYEKDATFLQTFGIGYDQKMERVVIAYTRYLSKLSPEHQQYWYSNICSLPCKPNGEYHKATLYGAFPINTSVYKAFLGEQRLINEICAIIGRAPLFNKIYIDERPKGFHSMLLPTSNRFYEFVLLLDKMVSDNINKKFFGDDLELFDRTEHNDGTFERQTRGSLTLLEKWIPIFLKLPNESDNISKVLQPLRRLRKLRQSPAHSINEDEYNIKYTKDQDSLIADVYSCMKILRVILMENSKAQDIQIPKWMEEDKVVIY